MNKNNIIEFENPVNLSDPLTDLLRTGARQLIYEAVEAELEEFMIQFEDRQLENGRAAVIRNGYQPERQLKTSIGPVTVKIPKVRAKAGNPVTFNSKLVPPWVRKTRSLEAALPWLYLKGISTGEMGNALKVLVGNQAEGFSPATVSRLKQKWAEDYKEWQDWRLDQDKWVYIWADGIYSGLRSEDVKLCALVIVGVNEHGEKHFLAIEDGIRESTQGWREVLLKLKDKGMNSPKLAVGDGAMGFWAAMDEIYPDTRHQRCWMHKTMNVLNCVPKYLQPKVKTSLHNIWQAETREKAEEMLNLFIETYDEKYPKATQCLIKDKEEIMVFYDFPAEHWQSLRTTNPIESTFATIRHRTKRSKGCLSRNGMLHMMFKLGECTEKNWHRLRSFMQLPKVITGVNFKNGIEQTESNQTIAL